MLPKGVTSNNWCVRGEAFAFDLLLFLVDEQLIERNSLSDWFVVLHSNCTRIAVIIVAAGMDTGWREVFM